MQRMLKHHIQELAILNTNQKSLSTGPHINTCTCILIQGLQQTGLKSAFCRMIALQHFLTAEDTLKVTLERNIKYKTIQLHGTS